MADLSDEIREALKNDCINAPIEKPIYRYESDQSSISAPLQQNQR